MNLDLRDAFFDRLYDIACKDRQVMLLIADMSARSIEKFKNDLPGQFVNTGISEQNAISVAAGLALNNKKVFVYSIIPFITMRCYEQIKVDICCMSLPVTIVGIGSGFSYAGDGPTHYAVQDIALMRTLSNMKIFNPSDALSMNKFVNIAYKSNTPTYVRIDKERFGIIHTENEDFSKGYCNLKEGDDLTIVSTGFMVHKALEVAEKLKIHSISASVIELYQIKPLNNQLLEIIKRSRCTIILEEHNFIGGIGSVICEGMIDSGYNSSIRRFAIDDVDCFKVGSREYLHKWFKLDVDSIVERILREWI